DMPGPRADPVTAAADSTGPDRPTQRRPPRKRSDDDALPPVDLAIEVADATGATARVPLSAYGPVRRPLPIRVYRRGDWEARFGSDGALGRRSDVMPRADCRGVDPRTVGEVRFVFDIAPAGAGVIDGIGFARPKPAFLRAR